MTRDLTGSVRRLAPFVLPLTLLAQSAHAANLRETEIEQSAGIYTDNQERSRQRVQLGADLAVDHPGVLHTTTYGIRGIRDRVHEMIVPHGADEPASKQPTTQESAAERAVADEYAINTVALNASQTWNKLTETRQSFSYSKSDRDSARGGSVGLSRWFYEETLRASLDVARTEANKPAIEFLDFDQEIVHVPSDVATNAADLALRHLASTTTIVDYKAGWTGASNRPDAWRYGAAVKQYVPVAKGAVHVAGTRYHNYGHVTTETTYGTLDAWESTLAWLQTLWTDGEAMVSYRFYREDERTRALGDQLTFGSDTISAGYTQRFRVEGPRRGGRDWRFTMKGSRYLTNSNAGSEIKTANLKANVLEMSLSALL